MKDKAAEEYRKPMMVKHYTMYSEEYGYYICPECGATNLREYQRHCSECGQRLKWNFSKMTLKK